MKLSRRGFLQSAVAACTVCLAHPEGPALAAGRLGLVPGLIGKHPSPYFKALEGGDIECTLCPQACQVSPGQRGACGVRQNEGGRYYSLVYGNPCALHMDPIEKKPFFHVLPATGSLSVATAGCNFSCQFCQNWEISQKTPEETVNLALSPQKAVSEALASGARSVASTYVEPTIFFEYMLDLAKQCQKTGLLKVMHSNGFINPGPLQDLIPYLDAACIDLKSSRDDFYEEICGGRLEPVKQTLRTLVKKGVHTEIVHLMIPELNDDQKETEDLIRFVKEELSPEVPVHFTRFYPRYKLKNLPPTPVRILENAYALAQKMGLSFPYVGNVPGNPGENTICPRCKKTVVRRVGYRIKQNLVRNGKCPHCGRPLYGIWTAPGQSRA